MLRNGVKDKDLFVQKEMGLMCVHSSHYSESDEVYIPGWSPTCRVITYTEGGIAGLYITDLYDASHVFRTDLPLFIFSKCPGKVHWGPGCFVVLCMRICVGEQSFPFFP